MKINPFLMTMVKIEEIFTLPKISLFTLNYCGNGVLMT